MMADTKKTVHSLEALSSNDRLELRSDEIQEILSHIPHGILRWGISMIFLMVLILLVISWIIKYPDVISSRVTITTQNPPVQVVARSTGKLVLFASENKFVKAGNDLAVIENSADIAAVFDLREKLEQLKTVLIKSDDLNKLDLNFDEQANLGELQVDYSNFLQSYLEYRFFIQNDYHANKIRSIENQVDSYQSLNQKLVDQKKILVREVELVEQRYLNNQVLYNKELISNADLAISESAYLQKKYTLENAEVNRINQNIQLAEYQKTIMDLEQQFYEKKRSLILSTQESYKRLQSQVAGWEQRYVLKAPIDGHVSFFKFWSDNQFVNIGDEVMTLIPVSGDIVGKIYMSGMGAGKIMVGQSARMKFDSYPFNEFGIVEGKIESISLISRDNQYLININLVNGLTTNYNKVLEFKQEMQGTVDIITEDLRIFERIFNQLRYIFSNTVF